ncbi:hypothetical protein C4571_01950 [Candidatus Parcubacteria bacterium]|nr:MAG: hypothetical protein C4571_01950 [Candidatus Parcubacteria bacterium]
MGNSQCEFCGRSYTKKRQWQKFCSRTCRIEFHQSGGEEVLRLRRENKALRERMKTITEIASQ